MGLALLAGLLGTLFGNFVEVSSTTFTDPGGVQAGTLELRPLNDEQANSLQFRTVAASVSTALYAKGFQPAAAGADPQYVAYLTYGIDDGRSRMVSVPTWGQTGGGTAVTTGTVNGPGRYGSFSATTTTMPTYGVIGSESFTQTTYKRAVNLDIYDIRGAQPVKVVELRAQSVGSCGNINSVITEIARGALEKYPGKNGKTQTVTVPWAGKC